MAVRSVQFTPEERKQRDAIFKEITNKYKQLSAQELDLEGDNISLLKDEIESMNKQLRAIRAAAESRFIEALENCPEDIEDTLQFRLQEKGVNELISEKPTPAKQHFLLYVKVRQSEKEHIQGLELEFKNALLSHTLPPNANIAELRKIYKENNQYIKENLTRNYLSAARFMLNRVELPIRAAFMHDALHPTEEPICPAMYELVAQHVEKAFGYKRTVKDLYSYKWVSRPIFPVLDEAANARPTGIVLTGSEFPPMPDNLFMLHSKVANEAINSPEKYTRKQPINLAKPKAPPANVYLMVSPASDKVKILNANYDEFDASVMGAIATLCDNNDKPIFTPDTLFRTMTHRTDNEDVSPTMAANIEQRIEKLWGTKVQIDYSEQLQKADSNIINGYAEETLLNVRKVKATYANGTEGTVYQALVMPVLARHALDVGQVAELPGELFDVKEVDRKGRPTTRSITMNEQRIMLRDYLLRRINAMKGNNAIKNNTIVFKGYTKGNEYHKGIFDVWKTPNPDRATSQKIRAVITSMLDYWKAIEYIKGYEYIKKNRAIYSIEIKL